jgi:hypothetical protein
VEDLDREVLALLAEDLLLLLLEDLARPVVGVDDVIAYVIDLLRRFTLEVLDCLLPLCFGNGRPPRSVVAFQVCR